MRVFGCTQRDGDTGTKSAAAAAAAAAAAEEAKVAEAERIQAAVSHVQRETRRKYRARVCEVEAAFSQLAADNRRLKARVGQLSGTGVGTGSGWVGEGGEGASGGELGGGGGRAGRIGGRLLVAWGGGGGRGFRPPSIWERKASNAVGEVNVFTL